MGEEDHKEVIKGCQVIMNKSYSVHSQEIRAHVRQLLVPYQEVLAKKAL